MSAALYASEKALIKGRDLPREDGRLLTFSVELEESPKDFGARDLNACTQMTSMNGQWKLSEQTIPRL
jgi:hypothetical protein